MVAAPVAPRSPAAPLIVACGLAAEAKIAAAPSHRVVAGGGDGRRLAADLDAAAALGACGLLSFGLAGGLAPAAAGTIFVADAVVTTDGERHTTDGRWTASIASRLGSQIATFAAADRPALTMTDKAALRQATGAALVDMESHIAARAALTRRLPFAAIRVITDAAERTLPHAAFAGMGPDGAIDLFAILKSLARDPGQLPALIRTGRDARVAFAALLRCRQLLGPGFALLDL